MPRIAVENCAKQLSDSIVEKVDERGSEINRFVSRYRKQALLPTSSQRLEERHGKENKSGGRKKRVVGKKKKRESQREFAQRVAGFRQIINIHRGQHHDAMSEDVAGLLCAGDVHAQLGRRFR